jgi:hypothetical protein
MAALLAASAALQYNDPDPARWIAIYVAGAAISVALPARNLSPTSRASSAKPNASMPWLVKS